MYTIEYLKRFIFIIIILFLIEINMILTDNQEDNNRFEIIYREENSHARLTCDLIDVAWWKRPNLLATRYGIILQKYRSKMSLEKIDDGTTTSGIQLHVLNIHHLQSNDSGIYECETLGAIRQFNLTVTVRLTTVELGAQLLSSHDSTIIQTSNQTIDKDLLHQSSSSTHFLFNSLSSNSGHLRLRENQLIRLTCVVARALPAAYLNFPFDIEYRVEKNSTVENDDKTYRTILVLILRINRYFHKRTFHCEAIQTQLIHDENKQPQYHRILSNSLEMDVVYGPTCSYKTNVLPQFFTGIRRSINLTCFMNDANPSKLNFTWLLPNGNKRLGYYLNTTSSYITVTPTYSEDFGKATCRAQNEFGLFGECHINIVMGGVPDPVESCHYTYQNATLQVNCVAGFHQGDEDFFCYMYKRQDNGDYSEHARLKGNCAFILPDLKPERYHDFRVFTKNKFGDNYHKSFSIAVGQKKETLAEKTRNMWPWMALCIVGTCLLSLLIICCCCHQIRRVMYKRKTKGNFDSLTYQNHNSNPHANSNGKHSLVHLKQNGNGTAYPVRPYRSKDYLISSETSSNTYRNNAHLRSIYTTEDELVSSRRNPLKETDLDKLLGSTNSAGSSATATIKNLSLNRNRPLFAAFGPQTPQTQLDDSNSNHPPLTIQRRSSFQTATKLNALDFYTAQEPFYLIDRQIKMNQRSTYSPERDLRERQHYREKRREYSPDSKNENSINMNRQDLLETSRSRENSLVVENHMLLTNEHLSATSSTNDQQWREMNAIDEIDFHDRYIDTNDNEREDFKDNNDDQNQFISNDDDRDRRSIDRISVDYHRDDDTTFVNYDRDDDRYRDDGIFV